MPLVVEEISGVEQSVIRKAVHVGACSHVPHRRRLEGDSPIVTVVERSYSQPQTLHVILGLRIGVSQIEIRQALGGMDVRAVGIAGLVVASEYEKVIAEDQIAAFSKFDVLETGLDQEIDPRLAAFGPRLVISLAGNDGHRDDSLVIPGD